MDDLPDPLHLGDVSVLADQILAKAAKDPGPSRVQFGSVLNIQSGPGRVTYASVRLDDAPADRPLQIPSITPAWLRPGLRVAVLVDPPHQMYVIGALDPTDPPVGRISLGCTVSGGGG